MWVKFRYLDGLRGVAALVVVFDHYTDMVVTRALLGAGPVRHMGENWLHNTPLYLLIDGSFAVTIFFVLSGIVLSAKFFRTKAESAVVASAAKRYTRLAIPALGAVLLACLLMKLHLFYNHQSGALGGNTFWQGLWSFPPSWHFALFQGLYGALFEQVNSYDLPLWTMQVELTGSFLVFTILALFGKLRNRWLIYIVYFAIFMKMNLLAFVLGVILCDMYYNWPKIYDTLRKGWWLPVLVVALLVGSMPVGDASHSMFAHWTGWGEEFIVFVHTIAAVGVIMTIIAARPLQWLLETKVAQFLGRISFSLYLTHFIILGTLGSFIWIHLVPRIGYRTASLVTLIPFLVVSFVFAYYYAKRVDEPGIRFSGMVFQGLFAHTASGPADADPAAQLAPVHKDPATRAARLVDRALSHSAAGAAGKLWSKRSKIRFGELGTLLQRMPRFNKK